MFTDLALKSCYVYQSMIFAVCVFLLTFLNSMEWPTTVSPGMTLVDMIIFYVDVLISTNI